MGIGGGNGFLGTSGHRQMMNPSVVDLQHRLVLELSVGLDSGGRGALAKFLEKFTKSELFVGVAHSAEQ